MTYIILLGEVSKEMTCRLDQFNPDQYTTSMALQFAPVGSQSHQHAHYKRDFLDLLCKILQGTSFARLQKPYLELCDARDAESLLWPETDN